MYDLETLKKLQSDYQKKFATVLKLQEESGKSGSDLNTPEYNQAKEDWLKAGEELKKHLDLAKA
jgi:hypothetical protein